MKHCFLQPPERIIPGACCGQARCTRFRRRWSTRRRVPGTDESYPDATQRVEGSSTLSMTSSPRIEGAVRREHPPSCSERWACHVANGWRPVQRLADVADPDDRSDGDRVLANRPQRGSRRDAAFMRTRHGRPQTRAETARIPRRASVAGRGAALSGLWFPVPTCDSRRVARRNSQTIRPRAVSIGPHHSAPARSSGGNMQAAAARHAAPDGLHTVLLD